MRKGLLALALVCTLTVSGGSTARAADTTLRLGDSEGAVGLWQRMLNRLIDGHGARRTPAALREDGIFGPRTERATRWFERTSDLPVDGVVQSRDRRQWLGGFMTCCGARKPTIARGTYDPVVGHLQLELNGWLRTEARPALVIDLVFGSGTEAAVRAYQSSHGLAADGVVGPKTWASLASAPS